MVRKINEKRKEGVSLICGERLDPLFNFSDSNEFVDEKILLYQKKWQ